MIIRFKYLLSLFTLFFAGSIMLSAQKPRNAIEQKQDRVQIQQGKANISQEVVLLRQFRKLRAELRQATGEKNEGIAMEKRKGLISVMQREILSTARKVGQAGHEIRSDRSEIRSESREIRTDQKSLKPAAAVGDRMDRNDDIKDLRDDKRDKQELKARLANQKDILAQFQSLTPGTAAKGTLKVLLNRFEQSMVRAQRENMEELNEDKGELREDRRERREDLRR